MSITELNALREVLGLTQSKMARSMGLSLRAYQEIEAQDKGETLKHRHQLLAERCSLTVAVQRRDAMLAMPSIRSEALDLVEIIRTGPAV